METVELTEQQRKKIESYAALSYANLKKGIIQDLLNARKESVIYRRFKKEDVVKLLENPQANEKKIRELSGFLYEVSGHYRRLVDYYSSIMLYNYTVVPTKVTPKITKKKYLECYYYVINECDKFNLKQECKNAIKIAVRDGVFFGLCYETDDSFYIKPFNHDFAQVEYIEDGCYTFSIDLNYFAGKEYLLPMYGVEFETAYLNYKGDSKRKIKGDKTKRYFEPKNGICIKADESDPIYSLPLFTGLLLDVYSIEDYNMIQKVKAENENFKALSMKMDVDEDGVPKMDYEIAMKYYNQACGNLPDGIGLILSPFSMDEYSFTSGSSSERNAVSDAVASFWEASGTSSLIFGSCKATSSASLTLSVKPDEAISYSLLLQIQRFFNKQLKKKNLGYGFKIEFLMQSIFNTDEVCNRYQKAAQYGVAGSKLKYAASLGISPSDSIGYSYLEDTALNIGTKSWITPLISSNTMSNGGLDSSGGRPTTEESGSTTISESNEQTRDNDSNSNR